MNLPFKVVCVDDSNRPNDIPLSKWVKKGHQYTVTKVAKLLVQGGTLGFKLEEINIDECFPYQYFAAHRFAIPVHKDWDVESALERLLEEAKKEVQEMEETFK